MGLGALESSTVSALGSSFFLSAMSGVWIHMAATSDNAALGFGLRDQSSHLLCSYISAVPTSLAPTASCAANMHNKEEWNAGVTNMTVREDNAHDHHLVHQGHVSAFPFTSFAVARETFTSQLHLHRRMDVFLSPSVSLSPFVCLSPSICLSPSVCVCLRLSVCLSEYWFFFSRWCSLTHGSHK